jgi:hypothetical protein
MSGTGTIDITNLTDNLKSTFIDWAVAFVYGEEIAVPGLEWVALPIISELDKAALREVITLVCNSLVMQAFFVNTAIRKASQAQDYVDAFNYKKSLNPGVSDEEYKLAEQKEISAFRNFVMVTN